MFFRAATFGVLIAVIAGIIASPTNVENNGPTGKLKKIGQLSMAITDSNGLLNYQPEAISAILPQKDDTGLFFLDPSDPTAESMGNAIVAFNTFQRTLQLIIRITSPCLIDNEVNSLLRKKANTDFNRQVMETRWLKELVGYRMKLINVHKQLWDLYNKIQANLEIIPEELEVIKAATESLIKSEGRLRQKTLRLILNVLGK